MAINGKQDFAIAPKEAELLWGKSKREIQWALWTDKVRARQALNTSQWFISYNSCVALWGEPIAKNLVAEIEGVEQDG